MLVACILVAAFFPFRVVYNSWFRSSYSGYHVHRVLGVDVENGDSFEYVSSLFDRSELRTKQWVQKHAPVLANRKSIFANHENGDAYYSFFIDGGNVNALFQFRDGIVVNHLNSLYQCPYSIVQHNKDYSPNSLLRHGALPVYVTIVVACGAVVWLASAVILSRKARIAE